MNDRVGSTVDTSVCKRCSERDGSVRRLCLEDTRVERARSYALDKATIGLHVRRLRWQTASVLSKAVEDCKIVSDICDPYATSRAVVNQTLFSSFRRSRKVEQRRSHESLKKRFEAYKQLCLVYVTSDNGESTALLVQIMTCKIGTQVGDIEERPS